MLLIDPYEEQSRRYKSKLRLWVFVFFMLGLLIGALLRGGGHGVHQEERVLPARSADRNSGLKAAQPAGVRSRDLRR